MCHFTDVLQHNIAQPGNGSIQIDQGLFLRGCELPDKSAAVSRETLRQSAMRYSLWAAGQVWPAAAQALP